MKARFVRSLNNKRTYGGVALLVVLPVAAALIAAPLLLAGSTVKSGIASRLAAITGGSVALSGTPAVRLWPYLSVTYRNVFIAAPTPDREPIATVERMSVKLAFWPALSGKTVVEDIELVRPMIAVPAADMATVFDGMWRHLVVEETAASRHLSVTVQDGIIRPALAPSGSDERLSGLSGTLALPSDGRAGSFELNGVWHGQAVALKGSIGDAGDSARKPVELSIISAPLSLALSGTAETVAGFAYEGSVSLKSPSLKYAAQWLGLADTDAVPALALAMNGAMNWAGPAARITDVSLVSGDWSASGRLDLGLRQQSVSVDGTLAMSGLPVLDRGTGFETALVALAGQDSAVLDLRLSAPTATYGQWAFTEVAGGMRVADGHTLLDIGIAESAGGGLAGQVAYGADGSRRAEIAFTNMDLTALAAPFEDVPLRPTGKADVTLKMDRRGGGEGLDGPFDIKARDGTVEGFSAQRLFANDRSEDVFEGATAFDTLSVSGRIENNIVFITEADLSNPSLRMHVTGLTDRLRRTLAFKGAIQTTGDAPDSLPFSIGGTLEKPSLVSLLPEAEPSGEPIR